MNHQGSIEQLAEKHYDLAIIGGGALGCAMSWEAASRGLRVILLERDDFGAATSANSLRIVHGGLRYLQNLDLRRSRKSSAERSALLRIAPHLVHPLKCAIPAQPGIARGRLAIAAGLTLNALLTIDRNRGIDPERRIRAGGLGAIEAFAAAAPGVNTAGLTGFGYWYDATMIDPERLSLAFALSARERGAHIFNHVSAEEITSEPQSPAVRIACADKLDGGRAAFTAAAVADCRGLCFHSLAGVGKHHDARSVLAVNLVLKRPPPAFAVGFPARDAEGTAVPGRLFFAHDTDGMMTVGTWYFDAPRGATAPSLDGLQLDVILEEINRATRWNIDRSDIHKTHLGLMPAAAAAAAGELTPIDRPIIIRSDAEGLENVWRIQTEKWTTVRAVAERSVDEIARACELPASPSRTQTLPLHGADFGDLRSLTDEITAKLSGLGLEPVIARLASKYGSNATKVADTLRSRPDTVHLLPGTTAITQAEIEYVLDTEMPRTLDDLVFRRLRSAGPEGPQDLTLRAAASTMGQARGWSQADIDHSIESCRRNRHDKVI